jgi:hypothetical protein
MLALEWIPEPIAYITLRCTTWAVCKSPRFMSGTQKPATVILVSRPTCVYRRIGIVSILLFKTPFMGNCKMAKDTKSSNVTTETMELTLEQVAEKLGVSPDSLKVKRAMKDRKNPFEEKSGVPPTKVLIRRLLDDFDMVLNRWDQFLTGKITRGGKEYSISLSEQQAEYAFGHMVKMIDSKRAALTAGTVEAISEEIPD